MKIIFLDIDGVLCTRRSHLAYGKEGGMWWDWDPLGCAVIAKACSRGARIVVSSTWRHTNHREDLMHQLNKYGLMEFIYNNVMPKNGDWATPDLMNGRGNDIDGWLKAHPEIQDYKILDDDSDMLEHQLTHFIHTHGEEGMTSGNIKKLLNWTGALKS